MTTQSKIEMKFVEACFLMRRSCTICGGYTEKVPVLCQGATGDGAAVRACESCLKARDTDTILRKHALWLEGRAAYVRGLVGQLELPTYEAWEAKIKAVDAAMRDAFAEAGAMRPTRCWPSIGVLDPDEELPF